MDQFLLSIYLAAQNLENEVSAEKVETRWK